jgi:hypothetical protein
MMGGIWFFHSLPFRRNGIVNSIHASQKKDKQEPLTKSSLSVQEKWYIHASQKKDEQEVFTRSSLFRSGGMVWYTRFPEEG